MSSTLPIEDGPDKRAKVFVKHAMDLFECSAKLSCAIYYDKTVSKSDISKSLGFGIGAIAGLALSFYIPEGGKVIGKGSGKLIAYVGGKIEKTIDSRKQKKLSILLEGFDLSNSKWKNTLLNAFYDIFLNFNIQMMFLLYELSDMTDDKCMWKLAKDAVLRIFHDLEISTVEILDEQQIIKSFLKGKSGEGFICDILHKMCLSELGKTIKVKGNNKVYKTSNLFEESDVLFESQVLMKVGTPGEFLYRRRFSFEDIESLKDTPGWEMSGIHDLHDYQEHYRRSNHKEKSENINDQYDYLHEKRQEIFSYLCSGMQQLQIDMTEIKERLNEVAVGLTKLGIDKQDTIDFMRQEMDQVQHVQTLQEMFIKELSVSVGEVQREVEQVKYDHGNRIEELEKEMKELREYIQFLKLHIRSEVAVFAHEGESETRGQATSNDTDFQDFNDEYFDPEEWLPKLVDLVKNGRLEMPAVSSIKHSVWGLKRNGQTSGTIFLVKIDKIQGVFLFSAGQNFETDGSFQELDMGQFSIHPARDNSNASGISIQGDLMDKNEHLLVLGYEGNIVIDPSPGFGFCAKEESLEDDLELDFFLLYLPESLWKADGLGDLDDILTVSIQDLEKSRPDEYFSIFGYIEPTCTDDITKDIVLSFGVFEKQLDDGKIIFDALTIESSCGAPAFGASGNVMGILLEKFDEADDGYHCYIIQTIGSVIDKVGRFLPRHSV